MCTPAAGPAHEIDEILSLLGDAPLEADDATTQAVGLARSIFNNVHACLLSEICHPFRSPPPKLMNCVPARRPSQVRHSPLKMRARFTKSRLTEGFPPTPLAWPCNTASLPRQCETYGTTVRGCKRP